MINPNMTPE